MNHKVCPKCIGDLVLAEDIRENGAEGECSFCSASTVTKDIAELAPDVGAAFKKYYQSGEEVRVFSRDSGNYTSQQRGESVSWRLQEMLNTDEPIDGLIDEFPR